MGAFRSGRRRGVRRVRWLLAAFGALSIAVAAAACSSGGSSPGASGATGTPVAGGTATFALQPSTTPNYIFPFDSSAYFSVVNAEDFQYLMYRPLYWFGLNGNPSLNESLSLADAPVYNGRNVTITMKGWKWSNGETVTAQNVVFWINMMEAVGSTDWGDFVPGGFPTNVTNVHAVGDKTVEMTMDKSFNTNWFTDNELSQITPMPEAWDRTASGPSHCTTTVSDCTAVYTYLDSQSKAMTSWVSSPIWSIVDGPWRLTSFNADGNSTFARNTAYSGPVTGHITGFQELPFTTDSAEYNVLQAGSAGGSQKIDVGYIPTNDAPAKPAGSAPDAAGTNPVTGYTLAPLYAWSINYFPLNFQSTTGNGPIIKQLYFRQALQYLMDQEAIIQGPLKGYGIPTVGPVSSYPTTFLSPGLVTKSGTPVDQFPYNPGKAKQLLSSHGWTVVPNGSTSCTDPSKCGAGIKKGQTLTFTLPYATGSTWIDSEMTQLQSNASTVGIKINLEPKPFNQVTALAGGNCVVEHISCDWDMGNWGGGWTFVPDYYPSGETLFLSGSGANSGGYSDPTNDSMINATLTNSSQAALNSWQNYLATQVPVIWQPDAVYQLTEIVSNLTGVTPQDTTLSITPEDWSFTS